MQPLPPRRQLAAVRGLGLLLERVALEEGALNVLVRLAWGTRNVGALLQRRAAGRVEVLGILVARVALAVVAAARLVLVRIVLLVGRVVLLVRRVV